MYSGWPFEKGCWDFSVEMLMIIFPSIWPDYGIDRDKHFGKQVSQTFDVPQTCRLTWNNDLKLFSRFGKLFGVHKHSTKSSVWLAVHSGAVNTRFSFFLWQSDATVSTDYCHRMQFVQQSVNRSQRDCSLGNSIFVAIFMRLLFNLSINSFVVTNNSPEASFLNIQIWIESIIQIKLFKCCANEIK